jgi:sterol desaturase/sphingolipid hydroxylase (fatty acid hydroxylase superfamily)
MNAASWWMIAALPLVTLVAALEGWYLRRKGRDYDWKAFRASTWVAVGRVALSFIPVGFVGMGLQLAWRHRAFDVQLSAAWQVLLFVVLHDFFFYWFHRLGHQVRWLWASHQVHHSPRQMNFSVAYRLSWSDKLSANALVFMPLVWLGFSPAAVLITLAFNSIWQFWFHTELIPKLGWLELVFNTPSHHRVHHGCNTQYLDKNFGGIFIVFDKWFGTYQCEDSAIAIRYGLVEQEADSYNPFVIAFAGWVGLLRDLRWVRRASDLPKAFFGAPGWRADGQGLTTARLREERLQPNL